MSVNGQGWVMRMVVAVLAMLFCLPSVASEAHGGVWRKHRVTVRDFAGHAAGSRDVRAMVDAFNQQMPKHAPRLVYRPMGEFRKCDELPARAKRGGIAVCVHYDSGKTDTDWWTDHQGLITGAVINVSAYAWQRSIRNVLCHELMHALTGISDNYGSKPDTSCVHGTLDAPGPFDIAYAKKVYKKFGGKERKRGKHR